MRLKLSVVTAAIAATAAACDCEVVERPETYKGADLSGCSSSYVEGVGTISCCSYDSNRCTYMLCQEGTCDDWRLESWGCW